MWIVPPKTQYRTRGLTSTKLVLIFDKRIQLQLMYQYYPSASVAVPTGGESLRSCAAWGNKDTKKEIWKISSALSAIVTGAVATGGSIAIWAVPRGHNALLSFGFAIHRKKPHLFST
jgi:hypothetical protein